VLLPTRAGRWICGHNANRPLQHIQKLLDSGFLFLGKLALAAE
jgi:hypothetical protein